MSGIQEDKASMMLTAAVWRTGPETGREHRKPSCLGRSGRDMEKKVVTETEWEG
jgi:hypothetical protein